jgi:potassium-transporting ATPase KdpC subunit
MNVRIAIPKSPIFLLVMTLLLGLVYPALVTGFARLVFPGRSGGSLLSIGVAARGSRLLAQDFSSPRFFRARPSATDYVYVGAGASNLGPTSADLAKAVAERKADWEKAFGSPAPEEMLYASASGVDPDIGLGAALAQLGAVASARGFDPATRGALEEEIRAEAAAGASLVSPPLVNVTSLNVLLETDPRFADKGR